jgi:uncharacterized membrane protein
MKRLGWFAMAFFALSIAGYAIALLLAPGLRHPFVQTIFARAPIALFVHLAGGGIALATGPFQINTRLRTRFVTAHRWLGLSYILAIVAGGIAGFALALKSSGGMVAQAGFGLLAVFWVGSTLNAYRHVRNRDWSRHRNWMIRSFALTLAAVTLRLYLPSSQLAGISFTVAYSFIAWLCWAPNLLVAEWYIRSRLAVASSSFVPAPLRGPA